VRSPVNVLPPPPVGGEEDPELPLLPPLSGAGVEVVGSWVIVVVVGFEGVGAGATFWGTMLAAEDVEDVAAAGRTEEDGCLWAQRFWRRYRRSAIV